MATDPSSPTGDGEADIADDETGGVIDDGVERPVDPAVAAPPPKSPLADLSPAELDTLVQTTPEKLGPLSIGKTSGGRLFNGVQMPEGPYWVVLEPAFAWGTAETIEYLARSIERVNQRFPASPRLYIGHISAKRGGALSPHISHQTGRDVDISYFYKEEIKGFAVASEKRLDLERTWAFVRALITETDIDLILIDGGVQRRLRAHAESIGEDAEWLDEVFQAKSKRPRPLVLHAKGHADHIHIRFHNPIAQTSARIAFKHLVKHGLVQPPVAYVSHKAKKGDTLGRLANRYGTTIEAIQKANGLRNTKIFAKRVYRIPKKGTVKAPDDPVLIPPRRLPPFDP
jgi:LysM repeat protein